MECDQQVGSSPCSLLDVWLTGVQSVLDVVKLSLTLLPTSVPSRFHSSSLSDHHSLIDGSSVQEVSFSAGEMLGSGGAEGACIYLIAQGQVDVLRNPASSSVSEVADADDDIADDPPCQYLLTCCSTS